MKSTVYGNRLYLRPLSLTTEGQHELFLSGGPLKFSQLEVLQRLENVLVERWYTCVRGLKVWAQQQPDFVTSRVDGLLSCLTTPRKGYFSPPKLMGILNVTPDSFSDGGRFLNVRDAIDHGEQLLQQGVDILDIGGESTHPGAEDVSAHEQCRRILPVIRHFVSLGGCVSVDTRDAFVMEAGLDAGASIINDVSALTADHRSLRLLAQKQCWIILMHMQGTPKTMQHNPCYHDVALDVFDWLQERRDACIQAGIDPSRLLIDPGIGFGKTVDHNVALLRQLSLFQGLGCPVVLGVSRKSLIAHLSRQESVEKRLAGSLALCILALEQGVQVLRVHNVVETRQAVTMWMRIRL